MIALALLAPAGPARAALIVNAARPITDRINVNLIATADDDGTDSTATTFGTATQQADVFSLVDVIYAQAGVDVEFAFRPGTYNSSFARIGTPGANDPRPQGDLSTIRNNAAAAGGILSSDANTINVFLVTIVPAFSQLSANSSAGFSTVGGNGVTYYGGSALPSFTGGREVLASVLAHEIGHNLGLNHTTASQNLMRAAGTGDTGQRLDDGQITTILASPFTVTAPATLDGDFNNDRAVDGADFLLWQRGGSPTPFSPTDLNAWRTNFGRIGATPAIAPTAGAVPEPAALALMLLATLLPKVARRRFAVANTLRRAEAAHRRA